MGVKEQVEGEVGRRSTVHNRNQERRNRLTWVDIAVQIEKSRQCLARDTDLSVRTFGSREIYLSTKGTA